MLVKVAELKLSKTKDYLRKTVKALEDAGFTLVVECDTITDVYYTVAEECEDS